MKTHAESAIAGMAMYEPDKIEEIKDRIPSPTYLENYENRKILEAAYKLHEQDEEVSPVMVAEELEGDDLRDIGGASSLVKKAETYSLLDAERFESCLNRVVENYVERESRKELQRAAERINNGENAVSVIQNVTAKLDNLQSRQSSGEISHVTESTGQLFDMLEEAKESGALPGTLSTGFPALDDRMKGISKTDFVLLSADTGVGKTSMALQIADTVAEAQDQNVLIFSGEMHGWEIIMKLLSKRGVATLDEMQDGEIKGEQWDEIVNGVSRLNEAGLYTIRQTQPTIFDFKSAVRQADSEHGIDLAVLDYVQMLDNPSPQTLDTVEHLNMVSSELRDFTNDMDIPVLAISRENKGGGIYGSSQLKYDCNYRIVLKDPEPENDIGKRLVKVEKARLAKGGAIKMIFQGENSRFIRPDEKEVVEHEKAQNGTRPF